MILFPVAAATDMNFGERAAYAGRMLLIGMATVFLSLAILWGALALFRLIMEKAGSAKAKKAAGAKAEATPAAPKAAVAAPAPAHDDGALVAAITAAVAAVLAAENGGVTPAFRVVSYRRAGR